jgi:hypothetical protein
LDERDQQLEASQDDESEELEEDPEEVQGMSGVADN